MGSENRREFSNGAKIGLTTNKTWRHWTGDDKFRWLLSDQHDVDSLHGYPNFIADLDAQLIE